MWFGGLFKVVQIYKLVDYGIDRDTGDGIDSGFAGDVLAVCGHGMYGKIKLVRYFFVGQTLGNLSHNIFLSFRQ